MKIVFWGTRGSLPSPLAAEDVQAKINAAIMRVRDEDIKSPDARQKFLSSLPQSIYGTTGGNTPCVQIISKAGGQIILDAGTGIRVLAEKNPLAPNKKYTILLSHLHWDHIQGFPFFSPIFNPEASFDIYSPFPNMAESLARQMRPPFFPVEFSTVKQRMNFHVISPGVEFEIEGVKVNCCKMCHPGASYSYSIREGAKKFVYGTDMELYLESHFHDPLVKTIFKNADAAVLDSQYTLGEAVDKIKWGHSPFAYAVDFAAEMGVKDLYLFHHDPSHSDKTLAAILRSARQYAKFIARKNVNVNLAVERMGIEL